MQLFTLKELLSAQHHDDAHRRIFKLYALLVAG
jgi:hypothetical protein